MNIQEIKAFLHSKPGYLKEGGKRLRNHLRQKGFDVTITDCKSALREARDEYKYLKHSSQRDSVIKPRVLIYDIETSYNIVKAFRAGYNLTINPGDIIKERKIICISYKWLDEDRTYTIAWDKNQDDKFLLEQFIEVLNEADLIVAHNGDRYDIKFIKARAVKQGLKMRIKYPSFDTLKVAKSKFLFNSNKLDYLGEFFGLGKKIPTTMALWDGVILDKCPKAMNKMIEYCERDVKLLEDIYKILMGWELPKVHVGVLAGKTKQSSPITGTYDISRVTSRTSRRGTVTHIMKDNATGREFEMSDTNYKKWLEIK